MNPNVSRRMPGRRKHGFTLIEVLIAVAIIGILTVIAIPSYLSFVEKSRRTDATAWLSQAAGEQIRYFSEENRYADTLTALGYDDDKTDEGYYAITVTNDSPTSFMLTATVVAGTLQAEDEDCASFSISSTGARTAKSKNGTASPDCW